jgi:hypothetical protein
MAGLATQRWASFAEAGLTDGDVNEVSDLLILYLE